MKRLLALTLALCLLLCGCGSAEETVPTTEPTVITTAAPTTEPATEPATEPTTEPATEPTTEPTTVPTEPELLYRHPITGEKLAEPMLSRPVAVVINNISEAQPLHGISQADVLFEILAEGGGPITRMLAIYTQLEGTDPIGSVRSARTYLIDLARAFQAPLVHCGGSDYALKELKASKYSSINQFYNGDYFYRDSARTAAGYAWEHVLFTNGDLLSAALEKNRITATIDENTAYGLTFADEVTLEGESAKQIDLRFFASGKSTVMTYDEATGCYTGQQRWKDSRGEFSNVHSLADGNTGKAVAFKNVFVLYAKTWSDGYRMFAELTGEGTGYYACGGRIVPVKWYRKSLTDPFTFTLEDGTPLTVGIGKTYIGFIPTKSPVTYE